MRIPLSDCQVRDPRQKRTRRLLQEALRKLLQEKVFEEILVQDIADVATVNRATFYDHYADKFALFEAMVANDFQALFQARNIRFDGTCASTLEAIVLTICDYLKGIHASKKQCASLGSFGPLLDSAVIKAIRIVLLEGLPKRSPRAEIPRDVIASTVSSAIYGATREWFYTGKRRTNALVSFIASVVPSAFEAGGRTRRNSFANPLRVRKACSPFR